MLHPFRVHLNAGQVWRRGNMEDQQGLYKPYLCPYLQLRMRKYWPFIAFLLLSGCLVLEPKEDPSSSLLIVELTGNDKGGDRIAVSASEESIILSVHSTSGIGRARISPVAGSWPTRMVFRVHLKGLESFSVNNGKFSVTTSIQSRPPYKILCETKHADFRHGSSVSKASAYWMPAKIVPKNGSSPVIPLEGGYIEVVVPEIVLRNRPRLLSIQWIDFWR